MYQSIPIIKGRHCGKLLHVITSSRYVGSIHEHYLSLRHVFFLLWDQNSNPAVSGIHLLDPRLFFTVPLPLNGTGRASHQDTQRWQESWIWLFHSLTLRECCSNPIWRHQMEIFSALLAIWAGNSPVTGEFRAQRPVTRSFDVFFDLRLNKRLSKQWWGCWFETPSKSLWRHSNALKYNLR